MVHAASAAAVVIESMSEIPAETPGVWTTAVDYANRHPAEVRELALGGGWVRILSVDEARVETVWLSASPPPWWGTDAMPDDTAQIEHVLHAERSAARREAWQWRAGAA